MDEKITLAAIKYRVKGETEFKYVHGYNHGQCIEWFSCADLYSSIRDMDVEEQGFMTDTGRFVSRDEAVEIAKKAGQLREGYSKTRLISEDLLFR